MARPPVPSSPRLPVQNQTSSVTRYPGGFPARTPQQTGFAPGVGGSSRSAHGSSHLLMRTSPLSARSPLLFSHSGARPVATTVSEWACASAGTAAARTPAPIGGAKFGFTVLRSAAGRLQIFALIVRGIFGRKFLPLKRHRHHLSNTSSFSNSRCCKRRMLTDYNPNNSSS